MNLACLILGLACKLIGSAYVVDGDTLRIDGQSIRLQGLDAEELSEPIGPAARAVMQSIVAGKTVECIPDGTKSYSRIVARCYVDGIDVAIPLIAGGWALDCPRYSNGRYRRYELAGARDHLAQKRYCDERD